MRLRNKPNIFTTLTGWVLVLAAFLGVALGNVRGLEIEHTHDEGHHQHEHQDARSAAFDGGGDEDPLDHNDHPSGDDTHTHHLNASGLVLGFVPDSPETAAFTETTDRSDFPPSESCPDGPVFDLIKPPQVG